MKVGRLVRWFPLVFFRWFFSVGPPSPPYIWNTQGTKVGTLVGFFFLLGFLLYERDQKFVRVFVGRFSHLPNLLYYLRGRPGGPPYPVGGPLGGFQKEPTFPIYNITFMTGKVGHPSRFS